MPTLNDTNKEIWQWLFKTGGAWTAAEIGERVGMKSDDVFDGVNGMARRELVKVHKGARRLKYAVDGTCLVPQGMRIAEVQA